MDISLEKESVWTIRDGNRIIAASSDTEVIGRQFADLIRMQNFFDWVSDAVRKTDGGGYGPRI